MFPGELLNTEKAYCLGFVVKITKNGEPLYTTNCQGEPDYRVLAHVGAARQG